MIDIIPAIDLIDGQCVRLRQGDFVQKTVYSDDPLSVARAFEAAGVTRLHLVDLDGARAGHPKNLGVLRSIAAGTGLRIDYSGGIREAASVETALNAGAAYIAVGSLAARAPETLRTWCKAFGPETFLVAADVRDDEVAVQGWEKGSGLRLMPFLETVLETGISRVFCTDIAMDGMMNGPAVALYQQIISRFPELRLIASGGVRDIRDVQVLEAAGCEGVIIGKALYEGGITLAEIAANIAAV